MRDLDTLRFIAARVITEVREHPSPGPLLGAKRPVGRGSGDDLPTRPRGRRQGRAGALPGV